MWISRDKNQSTYDLWHYKPEYIPENGIFWPPGDRPIPRGLRNILGCVIELLRPDLPLPAPGECIEIPDPPAEKTCKWTLNPTGVYPCWETSCKQTWPSDSCGSGPTDDDWKFCPFCGLKIEEVKP